MAWHWIGNKPLSEPMLTWFTDAFAALGGDELSYVKFTLGTSWSFSGDIAELVRKKMGVSLWSATVYFKVETSKFSLYLKHTKNKCCFKHVKRAATQKKVEHINFVLWRSGFLQPTPGSQAKGAFTLHPRSRSDRVHSNRLLQNSLTFPWHLQDGIHISLTKLNNNGVNDRF